MNVYFLDDCMVRCDYIVCAFSPYNTMSNWTLIYFSIIFGHFIFNMTLFSYMQYPYINICNFYM